MPIRTDYRHLSDATLSEHLQAIRRELMRRTLCRQHGDDPLSPIREQEMAKRALAIDAFGGHTIFFVGPPGHGKSMLRAAAAELDVLSFEARWCPCGYYQSRTVACSCTPRKILSHVQRWPVAEINVEVPEVSKHFRGDRHTPGTTLADIRKQMRDKKPLEKYAADPEMNVLMKAAVAEIGLSMAEQAVIQRVACTIAGLDGAGDVQSIHLCEAINYRSLQHGYTGSLLKRGQK